jgi:hypothetical protein
LRELDLAECDPAQGLAHWYGGIETIAHLMCRLREPRAE